MQVNVVSPTIQTFNGESFYLCGSYFQHRGKRLHREVWRYHHGEIPKGYHVHHIDEDRSHNDIENLCLMTEHDHEVLHGAEEGRKQISRKNIEKAQEGARKWHGSPEGLAYHSILGKENWTKRTTQTYTCSYCGKEFQTKRIYGKNVNHFCHNNCKAAFRRKRLRDESNQC